MPAPPQQRAPARFIAIYAFAYASLWLALLTPAMITLALRVRQLAGGDAARPISVVLFAGAIVALVGNPIFGALSDRTRSRFGRRRPYLVGGALCGFAALALIGAAASLTLVLVGWCLAQLAYNAVLAAMVAIVPDQIPSSRRGTVVGILGVCMPVGQIVGTFLVQQLAGNLTLALLVPGAIGLVGVLALAFVLPDGPPPIPAMAVSGVPTPSSRSSLLAHRDFSWAWLSRVLFVTGTVFLQAYQPFLLIDALGFDPTQVPRLIFRSTLVQAAMMVVFSLIAGRLSDRTGRRKSIAMAGSALQGLGLWLIAVANSYTAFLFGVALTGMGHGVYEGVNLALVTEVLPDRDRHAAKDLGLLNITNTLPQVIAPLAAPAILAFSGGDYTLLFLVAGAVPLMGAALLSPLKSVR
ncbi:MAG TPA: MFS transporter [Steroidobacteraceae bacterium]|jgi:MFS family permease|nr:MFS transporter [Steroidobacteraceae bacterium]